MAFLPLQIPPGIERNNTPYDTPGRWWDMNQVRWESGTLKPIGGWSRMTGTALDTAVRAISPWRSNNNTLRTLIGTDAKLWADSGSGYADVTPVGFVPLSSIGTAGGYGTFGFGQHLFGSNSGMSPSPVYSPYAYWSFGQWGEDKLATANSDGKLYYYTQSTPSTAPALVATAPTGNASCLVTAERFAMLIGVGGDPRSVGWSSREDYTDWNFSSTTNTAGKLPMNTRSPLLMGWNVREGVLVMSYTDVFLLQFIQQPYIYGGQNAIAETQLFSPMSVATWDGKAAWWARGGFQLYAGGFVQDLPCPILDDLRKDMDPVYGPFRVHAYANGLFKEITWHYPSNGQTECDRYVTWNYVDNWWSWGSLSRSAGASAGAYKFPILGASDGNLYQHEDSWLAAGMTRVGQVFAESGPVMIGSGDQTIDVSQTLIATGSNPQSVSMSIFGRYTPDGDEYEDGPFVPRTDGYTDSRFSYRDFRVRFTNAVDGEWGVGVVKFDVAPGSRR